MTPTHVQTLVVRFPPGNAVAHLILRIPEKQGRKAADVLALDCIRKQFSFGVDGNAHVCTSIGFTFAGLEALKVPESYLRVFRRLAPAFTEGAVRRSVNLADSGDSAPLNWDKVFGQERAHVLVSWHGDRAEVFHRAEQFALAWEEAFDHDAAPRAWRVDGERLGAPQGQEGEWVHFGFRDGLSEISIYDTSPSAPDRRKHAPGALLLGRVNDAGFNTFPLTRAPEKVRTFFNDSSFGILRKIQQDLKAFEKQVDKWAVEMAGAISTPAPRDFVKAKLCGRWPDGRQLRPGDLEPKGGLALDLTGDEVGEGCPFGSHVRRMRAAPDGDGNVYDRPLQRRGVPFGQAAWSEDPEDNGPRGLLAQFFCASIEDQFEHLVSQWAARPPLGFSAADRALDPFGGSHQSADAALGVPLKNKATQWLRGFGAWTSVNGMMYAWHPSKRGLDALLDDDFVPEEDERPWL